MSEFWDEMLIDAAVDESMKEDAENAEKELNDVDEIFRIKAEENRKQFEKNLKKEFKKQNRKREIRHPMFYRVATFVAVLLLVFDICVFTVPAIRSATVDFINRVTGVYTDIMRDSNNEKDDAKKEPLEKNEFGFDKEYQITYVPEGMVLTDYFVSTMEICYVYEGENKHLSFTQQKNNYSTNIDSEGANVSNIYINGYEAMVVEEKKSILISYSIGDFSFKIESEGIDKNETLTIAKSIREQR